MKTQKLFWSLLLLACGLVLQVSCSRMEMEKDRDDMGTVATSRSLDTATIKVYWDVESKVVHIDFTSNIGLVQVSVLNSNGNTLFSSTLNSEVLSQTIPMDSLAPGDYTIILTTAEGKQTSMRFAVG